MTALDPELDVAVAAMIAEDARFVIIGGFAVRPQNAHAVR